MPTSPFLRAMAHIAEAALEPQLWPVALRSVANAFGVADAACSIRNTHNKTGVWAAVGGTGPDVAHEYVSHFSDIDPWGALLDQAPEHKLVRLSQALPRPLLAHDAWYNEFLMKTGANDSQGICLGRTADQTLLFVLNSTKKGGDLPSPHDPVMPLIARSIQRALHIRAQLQGLTWRSLLAEQTLRHISLGLILVESDCRIVHMNPLGSQIIDANDGLMIRAGRICARRVFESDRLSRLVSAATHQPNVAGARLCIARTGGKEPYYLSVVPLKAELADYHRPQAMILVSTPESRPTHARDLADLFGLSPAEVRIAAGLMAGKNLSEIAESAAIKISTARTQLRSVLFKVGVSRQIDLVRILTRAQHL